MKKPRSTRERAKALTPKFWEQKTLAEMTEDEWEALCDGCANCCRLKLQNEITEEIVETDVVCGLLNLESCRCTHYEQRHSLVPDCVLVDASSVVKLHWLPETCAYRKLANGENLEWWHPLVSGDPQTVHEAGISVRGKVLSERDVHPDDIEEHYLRWT